MFDVISDDNYSVRWTRKGKVSLHHNSKGKNDSPSIQRWEITRYSIRRNTFNLIYTMYGLCSYLPALAREM